MDYLSKNNLLPSIHWVGKVTIYQLALLIIGSIEEEEAEVEIITIILMEPQTDQKQTRRRTFPRNSQGIKLHIINSSFSSKESWGIPQPLLVGWKNHIKWQNFCVYSKSYYVGLSFSISGGWWDFFWAKLITDFPKRQKPPRRSEQWWESSSSAGCLSLSQTWLQVKPTYILNN